MTSIMTESKPTAQAASQLAMARDRQADHEALARAKALEAERRGQLLTKRTDRQTIITARDPDDWAARVEAARLSPRG